MKALASRYSTPLLIKYGSKTYSYSRKSEVKAFSEWLNTTYNKQYKDVKEGDCFILWNGTGSPVPFVQMKDESPDKRNRPTRLLDGCYLSLDKEMRVAIVSSNEVSELKKEIRQLNY